MDVFKINDDDDDDEDQLGPNAVQNQYKINNYFQLNYKIGKIKSWISKILIKRWYGAS